MAFTASQREAFNAILNGHNIAILGQAGTGKSTLIRSAAVNLRKEKKRVAITASTGIAATQYHGGTTIHKWAGILDGRYDATLTFERLSQDAKNEIINTDVLMIDEISMISAKIFEKVMY